MLTIAVRRNDRIDAQRMHGRHQHRHDDQQHEHGVQNAPAPGTADPRSRNIAGDMSSDHPGAHRRGIRSAVTTQFITNAPAMVMATTASIAPIDMT
jgi:hypothetical protein